MSLEVRAVEPLRSKVRKSSVDAEIEGLAERTLERELGDRMEFSVVVRTAGPGDLFFKKNALGIEIRDASGTPLPSRCVEKAADLAAGNYVLLHSGGTKSFRLTTSDCQIPRAGEKYIVVALFDDRRADLLDQMTNVHSRPTPPVGAILITGRVESNGLVVKWPTPRERRITRR